MKQYAVYYLEEHSIWLRVPSHKVATRGKFKGQLIQIYASYTEEEAREIQKKFESEGYKTKIKEVK